MCHRFVCVYSKMYYFVLYIHSVLSALVLERLSFILQLSSPPEHPLTDLQLDKHVEQVKESDVQLSIFLFPLTDRLSAFSSASFLSLRSQSLVQATELPKEAVVRSDLSSVPHRGQSAVDVHVLMKHQVGYD